MAEMGWSQFADGRIITNAEEKFDVFVTIDQKLKANYNFKRFRLGFVILHIASAELAAYLPLFSKIEEAVRNATPGKAQFVEAPPATEKAGERTGSSSSSS